MVSRNRKIERGVRFSSIFRYIYLDERDLHYMFSSPKTLGSFTPDGERSHQYGSM